MKENAMNATAKGYRPDNDDEEAEGRSRLVRAPTFVDSNIFGGWGIKL